MKRQIEAIDSDESMTQQHSDEEDSKKVKLDHPKSSSEEPQVASSSQVYHHHHHLDTLDYKNPLSPFSDEESSVGVSKYVDIAIHPNQLDLTLPPFTGIMKQKFSDFIVHEIDRNGNVVYLTDTNIPDHIKDKRSKDLSLSEQEKKENELKGIEELKRILSENVLSSFESFLSSQSETEKKLEEIAKQRKRIEESDVPTLLIKENDKTIRSNIHKLISTYFSHALVSDTLTKDNEQHIRLRFQFRSFTLQTLFLNNQNNSKSKKRQKRKGSKKNELPSLASGESYFDPRQFAWPKDRPNYIQFVLYKENSETTEILGEIGRILKLKQKNFQIAGTKDKRGITTQLVTGYQISAEKLSQVNHRFKHKVIRVGNFQYVENPLRLGDLTGNRFTLVLRDLKIPERPSCLPPQLQSLPQSEQSQLPLQSSPQLPSQLPSQSLPQSKQDHSTQPQKSIEEIFKERIDQLNQYGFINYFGMQRFGITYNSVKNIYHSDYPTYLLGQHLLKCEWKELARCIFLSSIQSSKDKRSNQTLQDFLDGKITSRECYDALPRSRNHTEKIMLNSYLKTHDRDHLTAIQALPLNLLTMYIHSYQSYVFNHMVSLRIEKHGLKVVCGDLVISRRQRQWQGQSCLGESSSFSSPSTGVSSSSSSSSSTGVSSSSSTFHFDSKLTFESPIVRIESEEQAQQYSIHDVVMTIPGIDIQYPSTEYVNKNTYDEFMKQHGSISEEDFKKHVSQYKTYGAYRFMIQKAQNIEYEFREYSEQDEKMCKRLVETDDDKLVSTKKKSGQQGGGGGQNSSSQQSGSISDGHASSSSSNSNSSNRKMKKAVILSFSLDSSTYATMFIRELLRLPSVIDWKWIAGENTSLSALKVMSKDDQDQQFHLLQDDTNGEAFEMTTEELLVNDDSGDHVVEGDDEGMEDF
ncbi:hypothetical protein FDP41_004506 [Naegleria fowleri]|uniref:TRUD domain-containing protein n=1 Tax=Naegleria fowleri TaxID=5763 RepID=A0A6A5BI39_NAEFO|nr:uncharacterized protein FDP41_004506 [Naegleria fowleri]KAF0976607.1 hypothetical protein FDP41_004506 [Naegleria fowleri]